jgi:hypothetical protein
MPNFRRRIPINSVALVIPETGEDPFVVDTNAVRPHSANDFILRAMRAFIWAWKAEGGTVYLRQMMDDYARHVEANPGGGIVLGMDRRRTRPRVALAATSSLPTPNDIPDYTIFDEFNPVLPAPEGNHQARVVTGPYFEVSTAPSPSVTINPVPTPWPGATPNRVSVGTTNIPLSAEQTFNEITLSEAIQAFNRTMDLDAIAQRAAEQRLRDIANGED